MADTMPHCDHAISSMEYRVASHSNKAMHNARNFRSAWTCIKCLPKMARWCNTTAPVRVHYFKRGRKTEIKNPLETE